MVRPTTLLSSVRLNRYLGLDILLASETFQHTGNFKFRGAWHMASNVPHHHLLTSSSGNFGQALAFACQELNKRCTVVMPDDSVTVKVEAVREFGAEVELVAFDGRVLRFKIACRDERELIGDGFHERTIVDHDRFMARLARKQDG